MLPKLYFEIAEHRFVVESPDKDLTKKMLRYTANGKFSYYFDSNGR